jgi:hypothetical protein
LRSALADHGARDAYAIGNASHRALAVYPSNERTCRIHEDSDLTRSTLTDGDTALRVLLAGSGNMLEKR